VKTGAGIYQEIEIPAPVFTGTGLRE